MDDYNFTRSISNPDHFVNRYIDYASLRTDAAWDYHEALAFSLLAVSTQGLKWKLPSTPGGMRTNLYIILYGPSTFAKKSTSMDIASELQSFSVPGANLSTAFTPGSIEEQLAEKPNYPTILWSDEFTRVLDQMHHQSWMAGLRGFFLTMYGHTDWEYRRTSKGTGVKKTVDNVMITDSHLCIVGNVTPAILRSMKPQDIEDGFMARFCIVAPDHQPSHKPIMDMHTDNILRNKLQGKLHHLRDACKRNVRCLADTPSKARPLVEVEPAAIVEIDRFQRSIMERASGNENGRIMLKRVGDTAIKLSLLVAAGEVDAKNLTTLKVTPGHVQAACNVARKWGDWGVEFAARLEENDQERDIRRIVTHLKMHEGRVTRTRIAQNLHISKWHLDQIGLTMMDRGLLLEDPTVDPGSKKITMYWKLRGFEVERKPGEDDE